MEIKKKLNGRGLAYFFLKSFYSQKLCLVQIKDKLLSANAVCYYIFWCYSTVCAWTEFVLSALLCFQMISALNSPLFVRTLLLLKH